MWPFKKKKDIRRILMVELGQGNYLVGNAVTKEGNPCVMVCPAPFPGPPGEDASHLLPNGYAPDGSIALVFTTKKSLEQHRALLNCLEGWLQ